MDTAAAIDARTPLVSDDLSHCRGLPVRIGYAGCSTHKQDLTAQRQALLELGVDAERIYLDHGLTGNRNRPGLDQALAVSGPATPSSSPSSPGPCPMPATAATPSLIFGERRHHAGRIAEVLDVKDGAHYGLVFVGAETSSSAIRNARVLVDGVGVILRTS